MLILIYLWFVTLFRLSLYLLAVDAQSAAIQHEKAGRIPIKYAYGSSLVIDNKSRNRRIEATI